MNAVLTGSNWIDFRTSASIAQYSTSSIGVGGGIEVKAGYISDNANNVSAASTIRLRQDFPMVYTFLSGVQDTLTVVAVGIGGSTTAGASIYWKENY